MRTFQPPKLTILLQTLVIFIVDLGAGVPDVLVSCAADLPVSMGHTITNVQLLGVSQDFILALRHFQPKKPLRGVSGLRES